MQKVLIIQAEMKHYRVPFFLGLHGSLRESGIDLTVLYSNSHRIQAMRKDSADLPEGVGKKVSGRWFFKRFLYQDVWKEVLQADLIIIGPELKYLMNPIIMVMCAFRLKRVAFWGLGPNRHPTRSAFAEWIKQHFFTWVDWWFAYTETIAEYLVSRGMPSERITNVQNTTDTVELRNLIRDISAEEAQAARYALTNTKDAVVGLYCGMIAEIKSLPLLIESARIVKRSCSNFHLVIVGNGPDRIWLEAAIKDDPWIHYVGSQYGRDGALFYKMADVSLIAGTAGLTVVDSFAAELPLLATELNTHPPEITYVVHGDNGMLAPHRADAFAASIVEVFTRPDLRDKLKAGARVAGTKYTMEAMVSNFAHGVLACLEA